MVESRSQSGEPPARRNGWLHNVLIFVLGVAALGRCVARRTSAADCEPAHGEGEQPAVRYERRDANVRAIIALMAVAVVVAACNYAIIWRFFTGYAERQESIKQSSFPLAPGPSMDLPPEPRLEQLDYVAGNERPNVHWREESKEKVLNSFGTTADKGYVHIPIARALELVVDRLPVRPQPPAEPVKDRGLVDGGAPNSGRMFKGR